MITKYSISLLTALMLVSACGTSVIAGRSSNPTLIDPIPFDGFFGAREYPATMVTTDATKSSTVFVDHSNPDALSFCRQATPDVGLQLLNAVYASLNGNNSGESADASPTPSASIGKVLNLDGFELSTPTSIRYLEAAKEGLCELYLNYGREKIDEETALDQYMTILKSSKEIAIAEANARANQKEAAPTEANAISSAVADAILARMGLGTPPKEDKKSKETPKKEPATSE